MQDLIEKTIEEEAKKRLSKYSKKLFYVQKYRLIFTKRTGKAARKTPHTLPKSWSQHPQFDPRYCLNHAKFLSKGIWKALRDGSYKPIPSLRVKIAKNGGGFRNIDIFSIPDTAIARIFFHNLTDRNGKIFSSGSYAYQNDKTPIDAVLRLGSLLKRETIFISKFDFSSYLTALAMIIYKIR